MAERTFTDSYVRRLKPKLNDLPLAAESWQ
jgi:hypothetical protein